MSRSCPKHCSRLTSAAIFIAAGIVQMMAGLVLLRSEHVYLLAAPDLWTALTNVCVGCLVGVTATAWKNNRRSKATNKARYTLVGALFVSSFTINAVTGTIVILGESNALLSIQVVQTESGLQTTFASEILSYAYAASVLSSITCTVVSFISLMFMCCPEDDVFSKKIGKRKFKKAFEMDDSEAYTWVYTPEKAAKDFGKGPLLKSISSGFSNKSSSLTLSSSFGDFSSDLTSPILKTLKQNYTASLSPNNDANRGPQSSSVADVSFDSDSPPSVGEIVPILLRSAAKTRRPPLGIPVRSPVVPPAQLRSQESDSKVNESSPGEDGSTRPKTPVYPDSSEDESSPRSPYSSFQEEYERSQQELRKEYKKLGTKRIHNKRPDFRRLQLMEAIDEVPPDSEDEDRYRVSSPTASSGYGSGCELAVNASNSGSKYDTGAVRNITRLPRRLKRNTFEEKFMKNRLSGYLES